MAYQSPIPLRPKRVNPFDVFLRDPAGDGPDPSIEAARQQARKEIAGRSRPVSDFLAQGAQSALGGLKAIPDFIPGLGPTSMPSEAIGAVSDYVGSLKSPQQQMREQLAAEQMATMPEDDWYGRGLLTGQNLLSDPGMTLAKAGGNILPFAGIGRIAKAANVGGRAAGAVTNALMGGGAVRGGAYEAVQQAPDAELMQNPQYASLRATMPESEAKRAFGEVASSFEEAGGKIALGGLLGLATGALGAEGKIAELAAKGAVAGTAAKSIPVNALRNLATEGVSEFGEEGSQQYLSNVAAGVNPMRGVAEGAVEGGLIGAGMGGGVGIAESAAERLQNPDINRNIVSGSGRLPPREPVIPSAPIIPAPIPVAPLVDLTGELPDDPEGEMTAEEIAAQSVPSPIDDIIAEARANALVEQPLEASENVIQPFVEGIGLPDLAPAAEVPLLTDSPSPIPDLTNTLPVGGETLPPAEGVDSVGRPIENLGAPEAEPLVDPSLPGVIAPQVGIPDRPVVVQERVPEGDVQPVGIEPAPATAPSGATQIPAVDTTTLPPDRSSETVAPTDSIGRNMVSASPATSVGASVKHAETVAQPQKPVKAPIRGLDRVKVGDRFGTVNSRQKDGSVNVSFDDGSVQRVPISSVSPVPAVQPEEQLEVVEDALPDTPQGIIGIVRNAFPKKSRFSEEFQKAATAFEADIQNVDKMAAFLRAARGGAFDAVVEAVRSGKDPIKAAQRLAVSGDTAKEMVRKVKKYLAAQDKVPQEQDLEGPLRASIEANKKPSFARGESPQEIMDEALNALATYQKTLFSDLYALRKAQEETGPEPNLIQRMLSKAFSSVEAAAEKARDKIVEVLDPELAQASLENYSGVSDSERATSWAFKAKNPAAPVLGTSKFNIYDFEGDVDKSVIDGLSKMTKGLADAVSSVASKVSMATGFAKDTFAGFAPNGNLAGVSYRGKWYLNPLKYLKSNDPKLIAKAIVKTIAHEMIHVNGLRDHDAAFDAEFDRVYASLQPLLPGMEREVAKFFDKNTIAKLRGLYDTAEKGWIVAKRKGRERAARELEGRSDARPVPSVRPKVDRDGSLPPPDAKGQGRKGAGELQGRKAEGLGPDSESRPTTEPAAREDESGRPGVLEKPQFAREPEEEAEKPSIVPELPEDTPRQKMVKDLVYSLANKYAKIGETQRAVEQATGKAFDIDLEEAATSLSPRTAAILKEIENYTIAPMVKVMGLSKISPKEAWDYAKAKALVEFGVENPDSQDEARIEAAEKAVEEIESGEKAQALKDVYASIRSLVAKARERAGKSGLRVASERAYYSGDGIESVIEKVARTIVKANENVFRQQMGSFLSRNISKDWALNPKNPTGGHTISYFFEGKKQRMWFKDKVFAQQIENMSDGETSWFMDMVRRGTRAFAVLNTRANPVFAFKNFARDLLFGLGKIYVDDGPEIMGATWRNLKDAMRTMHKYAKDQKSVSGSWGKTVKILFEGGGVPSWFGMADKETITANLERDISQYDGSKKGLAYKQYKRVVNAMRILSEVSEATTRLAYFKALTDSGIPEAVAIKKTRGITGDFQKHGTNKNLRYMYAFFGSSVAGIEAMRKLGAELKDGNPRAKNLAMFLVSAGVAQVLLGMAAGDDDEDGQNDYEQQPEYLKNSSFILPIPGYPVAIPLPYGLNVPVVLGMGIARSAFTNEEGRAAKSAMALYQSMLKSFNPLGDDASLLQLVSPTLLDPLAQSSENIDSLGRKIVRDRYPGEARLPQSQISSKKDSTLAKSIAETINDYTGGDEVRPGFIDVHPGTIDNTARWMAGSVGRFIKDSGASLASVAKGEKPEKIPLWNDFVKTPQDYFYTGRFWDQLEEIRGLKDSAKQLDENARREQLLELGMDPERVESFTRTDLKKVRLSGSRSNALQKEIEAVSGKRVKLLPMYEELRKQISALQKSGDENADERIKELVKAANRKYMEATR